MKPIVGYKTDTLPMLIQHRNFKEYYKNQNTKI